MKIPKDPHSIHQEFIESVRPTEPKEASSSGPIKDSLEAFLINELNLSPTKKIGDIPLLQTPEITHLSLIDYFKKIHAASLAFRQQLRAADLVDQETRRHSSQAVAEQALALAKLYNERSQAIAQLEKETKQAVEELQKKLEEMQKETKQQQDRIDQINAGNAKEKQKYQELTRAYDDYIEKLKSIGAVDQGNGNYSVPEEAKDQYNAFTKDYQKAVENFNEYWKERQAQINQYNSATIAYNQSVAANNKAINDLIDKYKLSDFLKQNGWAIPKQPNAKLRDLSGYKHQIIAPSPLHSTPAIIPTFPLPTYTRSIGSSGPPSLPKLENFAPIDGQALYDGVYRTLYDAKIAPLDQNIQIKYLYWAFVHMKNLITPIQDLTPDPLLNTKMLTLRILPAAFIESSLPTRMSRAGASAMSLQAIGLGNSMLADILGRSMLKQAIENFQLKSLEEKDAKFKEQKINQLVDQLLLLSVGLLGNQSLQALFPSLSAISPSLDLLPKDSPAFALLFAVSFANRIQEDAKQGITGAALQTFLKGTSDLANLTDADQAKLEAILNLGQLLVASKLLEANLGLEGLLAQLLPTLLPSLNPNTILSEAAQESRQDLAELANRLQGHFVSQGYSEEKAHFLAQVGSQLVEQGLLTPTVTLIDSSHALNQMLLVDSLKAALVLSNYSLTESHTIAHTAVERTLAKGHYPSTQQFRIALESHLQELGVREKSSEIALQAILIPAREKSLDFLTPSVLTTSTLTDFTRTSPSSYPSKNLSPVDLIPIVEKRVLQLLSPQLGNQLAKQLTDEIAKTLFGTPPIPSQETQGLKSPYSLVSLIKDQLYQLKIEENQDWATMASQTFKETIKTMESFYHFSLKIMDPAYLFVYVGIIYEGQGKKKQLDILI
jgi:hypothetical protein